MKQKSSSRNSSSIPGTRQKPKVRVVLPLLPLFLLLGWILGFIPQCYQFKVLSISSLLDHITSNWNHPLCIFGTALGFSAWLLFISKHLTRDRQLEEGREYGEARFAMPKELIQFITGNASSDKILSQHLHMDLDDRHTGLNASCLLIGGSGSGKSFRYVAPNLLQANSSFVVTDPKGTLLEDYGSYLPLKGYQVKVININSPACSDAFNPFAYIHSNKDIVTLVNDYIRATTPKNSSEGEVFCVDISIRDAGGIIESGADRKLTVEAEGGQLLGFGSANPRTEERFDSGEYTTYYGRAMAVIRAGQGESCRIKIDGQEKLALPISGRG